MSKAKLTAADINFAGPLEAPPGRFAVSPPGQPMPVARELVKALYTQPDGIVLRSHRGDFYQWDGARYLEIDKRDVRRAAYQYLEHAVYFHLKLGWLPFAPTQRKVADVLEALHAVVLVESRPDAPLWIDHCARARSPAHEIVAMTNGLLHLRTRTLQPHSTHYFNHHALPFAFDPHAPPADTWLQFLAQLWGNDEVTIECLQEAVGYILGGDTSLQKVLLFVGPKRAGKGTIGRVLTGLLGTHHVAAPTFASLSTNFGLQPLIGKPLALISDARLSNRAESYVVVERLLSISGEDSLTIDRKYRDPWTGKLPTRFLVMTNELPKLTDASGALASRFIIFVLTKSFYGNENPRLTDQLLSEAPGIFNWALEGLDRLVTRGYLLNPESGQEAVQQLEDLSSPIGAFLRDCCVLEPEATVPVDDFWKAWKDWCDQNGQATKGTKAELGRDLRAAVPTVKRVRIRKDGKDDDAGDDEKDDEKREYVYRGLRLRGVSDPAPP